MLVDCGTCEVRGVACGECVLTVLWGLPGEEREAGEGSVGEARRVRLDAADRQALRALADAGLVPPLLHVDGPGRRAG